MPASLSANRFCGDSLAAVSKAMTKAMTAVKEGAAHLSSRSLRLGNWSNEALKLGENEIQVFEMGYLGSVATDRGFAQSIRQGVFNRRPKGEYFIIYNETDENGVKHARAVHIYPVRLNRESENYVYAKKGYRDGDKISFWPIQARFIASLTTSRRTGHRRILSEEEKTNFLTAMNESKEVPVTELSWTETARAINTVQQATSEMPLAIMPPAPAPYRIYFQVSDENRAPRATPTIETVDLFPTGVQSYLRNLEDTSRRVRMMHTRGGYLSRVGLGLLMTYLTIFYPGYVPLLHSNPAANSWNGQNYSRYEMWNGVQDAINEWDYLITDQKPIMDLLIKFYEVPQEVQGKKESLERLDFWETKVKGFKENIHSVEFMEAWLADVKAAPIQFVSSNEGGVPQSVDDLKVDASLLKRWFPDQDFNELADANGLIPANIIIGLIFEAERVHEADLGAGYFFRQILTYQGVPEISGQNQTLPWDAYHNYLLSNRNEQSFLDYLEAQSDHQGENFP